MPSVIVGFVAGGQLLVSGTVTSGRAPKPQGGIQLKNSRNASGSVYVALSGGMTVNSGGVNNNSGAMDGVEVAPGDAYWVPAAAITTSGAINVYLGCDAAASGQARVYYEIY